MYRANPQRTGYIASPGPTEEPSLNWSYEINSVESVRYCDDVIYVSDADTGVLHALTTNGVRRWRLDPFGVFPENHSEEPSQIVIDPETDTVVIVTTRGGIVLYSPDRQEGQWMWPPYQRAELSWPHPRSEALVTSDGSLFVLLRESLLEVDLREGEVVTEYCFGVGENDGLELVADEVPTEPIGLDDPLAYKNGSVLLSGPTRVDLPSGDVRWEASITKEDFSDEGRYEVQLGSEWFGIQESDVYYGLNGALFQFDWKTGERHWSVRHDTAFKPVLTDSSLYTRVENEIVAYDTETGDEAWRFTNTEAPLVSPVVAGDFLYTGEYQGGESSLFGIDAKSGEVAWETTVPGPGILYELIPAGRQLLAKCGDQLHSFK